LIALGFLIQDIKTSDLSKEYSHLCFKTLLNVLNKPNNNVVLLEALKCSQILIPFMKSIFENEVIIY